MGANTRIEWTDFSWSPWIGCTKISEGCEHCYAAHGIVARNVGVEWGPGKPRCRTSQAYWRDPLRWNKQAEMNGVRYRVFPSQCDVFDLEVPTEWLGHFWQLIADTPHLYWLLLTKRIDQAAAWFNSTIPRDSENYAIGVTAENQKRWDERVPTLLQIPVARRFVSVEPMLGPIDMLQRYPTREELACGVHLAQLHQVIFGGESGPHARPCNVDWIRDGVVQCRAAGVPVFVKQDSGRYPGQQGRIPDDLWTVKDLMP